MNIRSNLAKPPFSFLLLNSRHREISPEPGPLDKPSPLIDPSDPAGAIVHSTRRRATICKCEWQKHCKQYRERAKGRISFRNFPEGDLVLLHR
jgi:hypothetical protein